MSSISFQECLSLGETPLNIGIVGKLVFVISPQAEPLGLTVFFKPSIINPVDVLGNSTIVKSILRILGCMNI